MKHTLTALALVFFCLPVFAVDRNVDDFDSPEQEARYKTLLKELRCVLCQNQSLADSNAEIAQSLRDQVREMLDDGKTDQEIIDFLVSRYGDFVLYNPPLQSNTYLLWLAPFLLILVGGVMLFSFVRPKKATTEPTTDDALSADEQDRLQQLLNTETTDKNT
ncbi:MAG: cytochrome c-type biogenesis protein [Pseudomonadota bacterium]